MPLRYFDVELAAAAESLVPSDLRDADAARQLNRERHANVPYCPELERCRVEDTVLPTAAGDVPVRLYRPHRSRPAVPAVLWLHGGAFILGDLDASDSICARISEGIGGLVVNVDYRLAPEHPAPAGLNDSYAALLWLAEHTTELGVDPQRVAVAGNSAGGCLAAGVALLARDRRGPSLAYQLLIYPVLDDRGVTESVRTVTDVPVFTAESNTLMWQTYLAGAQADGYISPARMADVSGLPPTYVMAAQHDPLRDEALDYARRLVSASVEVDLRLVSAAYHGFDAVVPAAAISLRESNAYIEALARALGSRRWD